jgi:hypothetical protein
VGQGKIRRQAAKWGPCWPGEGGVPTHPNCEIQNPSMLGWDVRMLDWDAAPPAKHRQP